VNIEYYPPEWPNATSDGYRRRSHKPDWPGWLYSIHCTGMGSLTSPSSTVEGSGEKPAHAGDTSVILSTRPRGENPEKIKLSGEK
jgi:hypothetical protein